SLRLAWRRGKIIRGKAGAPRTKEAPTMATIPKSARPSVGSGPDLVDEQGPIPTFPPRQLDEHGRLVPIPEEGRRARASAFAWEHRRSSAGRDHRASFARHVPTRYDAFGATRLAGQ